MRVYFICCVMDEFCYRLCCSDPAERYIFLCLRTVHAVYLCSRCWNEIKDTTALVYDLSINISRQGVPNPLIEWSPEAAYILPNCSVLSTVFFQHSSRLFQRSRVTGACCAVLEKPCTQYVSLPLLQDEFFRERERVGVR